MLETTTVGSFPKPDYLIKARESFRRGKIEREKLAELERQATEECIRLQERVGLDILVHGEMERGDMTTYFAELLEGMSVSGLVRSYGNRYYRKPIVEGDIKRPRPMTVEMWKFAQSLTEKPVKGMLTGPYTMCDWSFNRHYPSRREVIMGFAEVIGQEVRDLEAAGAKYIQIDEPALSTRPYEIDIAIEAMSIVTKGIRAYTITHICYGDFDSIYPRLLDLPVKNLDLEFANSNFKNLEVFREPQFTKDISLGVIDIHSHVIESKDQVKDGIEKAIEIFEPEKMFISPDCGLKTRTQSETEAKLSVMVEAVREVKEAHGFN
jgi:5-methyltetrahydropteroyltriglutamate--homocysteine methyltransferase